MSLAPFSFRLVYKGGIFMKKTALAAFILAFSFVFLPALGSCTSPEIEFDQTDFILDASIQTTYDAQKYYMDLFGTYFTSADYGDFYCNIDDTEDDYSDDTYTCLLVKDGKNTENVKRFLALANHSLESRGFAPFCTAEVKYAMKELEDASARFVEVVEPLSREYGFHFSTGIVPPENKVYIWYDEDAVPDKFLAALNLFPEDMRVLNPSENYTVTLP